MRATTAVLGGFLLLVGALLGVAGERLVSETPTRPPVSGGGTLAAAPRGPLEVRAETVRLGAGFFSRHVHGGPTFNTVVSGEVEVDDSRGTHRYGPGDFFFEPGGVEHSIRVLADARLDVVRLLPPGAAATTEVSSYFPRIGGAASA